VHSAAPWRSIISRAFVLPLRLAVSRCTKPNLVGETGFEPANQPHEPVSAAVDESQWFAPIRDTSLTRERAKSCHFVHIVPSFCANLNNKKPCKHRDFERAQRRTRTGDPFLTMDAGAIASVAHGRSGPLAGAYLGADGDARRPSGACECTRDVPAPVAMGCLRSAAPHPRLCQSAPRSNRSGWHPTARPKAKQTTPPAPVEPSRDSKQK
jgi:hypothetical protein